MLPLGANCNILDLEWFGIERRQNASLRCDMLRFVQRFVDFASLDVIADGAGS